MRKVIWTSAALLGLAAMTSAQEESSGASGFFRGRRVSFWADGAEKPAGGKVPAAAGETLWAEPIRMPDGQISVYVPPKAVLEFLDQPSEESGRAYLAWQKARMERIARASEILGRLVRESRPVEKPPATETPPGPGTSGDTPAGAGPPAAHPRPALPGGPLEILYFKKDDCPHCRREDAALAELARERPDVKVRVFTPDQEEALWSALEIKVVPTVVIRGGDGRLHVSRGYTPKEVLLEKLGSPIRGTK